MQVLIKPIWANATCPKKQVATGFPRYAVPCSNPFCKAAYTSRMALLNQNSNLKFLHHSTSSFLVPCSIFQTNSCQFAGRRPNGMLTRGTRARTQTIAKKIPSSFNFIIQLHHSLFLVQYSKQLHVSPP